ncbi:MAG: undecaprenyldiphospho-muramoylpentapeptide beta-N-acetylglucosaminyltransferase [Amoebophilaceae bacterium]|nr:undecaprenyldiphospho-muramoylpentapeptide beta-N-acetylglucosaminyltransferase [Amoebophilaceae bacterium]
MRILIGCGGTGGHIYPAIAIADAMKAKHASVEFLFVGKKGGMEMEIIPTTGYPIIGIDIKGLQRKKIIPNLTLPFLLLKSLYQARKIIRNFKPNIVIGTGGYACLPTLLAAYTQGIPTLIQEQNSVAGLTNRLLARLVTKICVGYPAVAFPCAKKKIVVTGNPVRPSIYTPKLAQGTARDHFNLVQYKKCLLVIGGSGGADQLNTTILATIPYLHGLGLQILWITGKRYFPVIQHHLTTQLQGGITRCYPFVDHMAMAYAAADMVVSRAGALSIAELCVAQKPTILVPSPHVVHDHQTKNSLPLVAQGAAISLADKDCSQLLLVEIVSLLHNKTKQMAMIQQMEPFKVLHTHALDKITEEIWRLAKT